MKATPRIKALAPWYGAKRTTGEQIAAVLGEHLVYWEPFCGSMAVLFAKPPCKHETVNDLNSDLIALARTIADEQRAMRLEWRLRRTLAHEGLFRESVEHLRNIEMPEDERAYWFFVHSWLGMNGLAGTDVRTSFAKRYTSDGGCPAKRFAHAVDSLPWWHERLRNVAIYSTDGIGLCEKIEDKAGTVVYCDPPYLEKNGQYTHDFTEDDHERLATALRRFALTRVVVSYYAHPALAELYPGWQVIPLKAKKVMAQARHVRANDAPEVLLVNHGGDK